MQKLHNLDQIIYFWEKILAPQRLKSVFGANPYATFPWFNGIVVHNNEGARSGVHTLINTLTSTDTQPGVLDLAVKLGNAHTILINAARDDLLKVLRRIESLTLRDKHYPTGQCLSQHSEGKRVCLTKALFPGLISLTMNHCDQSRIAPIFFPHESKMSELADITITNGRLGVFLAHYGNQIQRLTMENSDDGQSREPCRDATTHGSRCAQTS